MFLFCLVFAMFCARLFICALWSPAGKGLTSWLSFVVSSVSLSLSHWYPGSGVVLDCIDSWSLQPYYFNHNNYGLGNLWSILSCRCATSVWAYLISNGLPSARLTIHSLLNLYEPRHEISNNVVCDTSKGSYQPAHTRSLIRAFASHLNIL